MQADAVSLIIDEPRGCRGESKLLLQPHGRVSLIAVRFDVRGAYLFFPGPLSEITNRDVELVQVWGRFAHEVADRVAEAREMRPELPSSKRLCSSKHDATRLTRW